MGIASGLLGAANIAGNLLGPGLAILFLVVLPDQLHAPGIALGVFAAIALVEVTTMLITIIWVPDHPAPESSLSLVELPGSPMEACWHVTVLERQSRSNAASALRLIEDSFDGRATIFESQTQSRTTWKREAS